MNPRDLIDNIASGEYNEADKMVASELSKQVIDSVDTIQQEISHTVLTGEPEGN